MGRGRAPVVARHEQYTCTHEKYVRMHARTRARAHPHKCATHSGPANWSRPRGRKEIRADVQLVLNTRQDDLAGTKSCAREHACAKREASCLPRVPSLLSLPTPAPPPPPPPSPAASFTCFGSYLASHVSSVTALLQCLGESQLRLWQTTLEGRRIGHPEVGVAGRHTAPQRQAAGQERGPTRRADGGGADEGFEAHPARGQLVYVLRPWAEGLIALAAEIPVSYKVRVIAGVVCRPSTGEFGRGEPKKRRAPEGAREAGDERTG